MKAPWLTAAGYPERVALIHMFTSPRWRKQAMNDDFHVSTESIAKFHQRFPTEGPIHGTSRDGTTHNELGVHPGIQDHGWQRRPGT